MLGRAVDFQSNAILLLLLLFSEPVLSASVSAGVSAGVGVGAGSGIHPAVFIALGLMFVLAITLYLLMNQLTTKVLLEQSVEKTDARLSEMESGLMSGYWSLALTANAIEGETWWSDGMFKLFDCDPNNFVPSFQNFLSLVAANDRSRVETSILGAIETASDHRVVYRISRRGISRYLRSTGTVVRDAEGEVTAIRCVAQDVTHLRRAELAFERLSAQLSLVHKYDPAGIPSRRVAHDFNNVLAPILGYSELLMLQLEVASPLYKNTELILDGIRKAISLVAKKLVQDPDLDEGTRPMDLVLFLNKAVKSLHCLQPDNCQIDLWFEPGIDVEHVAILADAKLLHRAVIHLAMNAWQSLGHQQAYLKIGLKIERIEQSAQLSIHPGRFIKAGDYYCVSFNDSGCGMSAAILAKIFEPFFTTQLDDSADGMGLNTSLSIVRRFNGDMRVTSSQGIGSCVEMLLPILHGASELGPSKKLAPTNRDLW